MYVRVLDNALGYLGSREPLKIKAIIASIALDLKNAKETERNLQILLYLDLFIVK